MAWTSPMRRCGECKCMYNPERELCPCQGTISAEELEDRKFDDMRGCSMCGVGDDGYRRGWWLCGICKGQIGRRQHGP